jgi:RNA polymerase sigma-70 factor, ECF subfamily
LETSNPQTVSPASIYEKIQDAAEAVDHNPDQLLQAYLGGNDAAFEELFRQVGSPLFNYICRYLGDYFQAEDVYQNLCIKVATQAGRFERRSSVTTWLYQIARNACVDKLRSEGRKARVFYESEGRTDGGASSSRNADPGNRVEQAELTLAITRAVENLPEEQREVFLLKEEGGRTFEEIGSILGCGKETAKSRMRYALERLRNSLGREARLYGLQ